MKYNYLLITACLIYLFTACKPDFDLNASYKNVTVVYGILNHQDSIHYVKIYRGYQAHEPGSVFLNAQNPDSIYYKENEIRVVLREYKRDEDKNKDIRTTRPEIPLKITHDFPRDEGVFYYDKEKIMYYTAEPIHKGMVYEIVITGSGIKGDTIKGKTPIVEGLQFKSIQIFKMVAVQGTNKASVQFYQAKHAADYEIHVNFLYFEVDKKTNQVVGTGKVAKNITPRMGELTSTNGEFNATFTKTFYNDIAVYVKPATGVTRYIGSPARPGVCIEFEGYAAEESFVRFLLTNQPSSSFNQVNTKYTNLSNTKGEGLVFGFFSSRAKSTMLCTTDEDSQNELIRGPETGHLGFRNCKEYNP